MSNLQMIEALCTLCEEQSQIIGSEEWPDPCPEGREEA